MSTVPRLQSLAGTVPFRPTLSYSLNTNKAVKAPSCDGTVPMNELSERSKEVKAVKDPSCDGTVPVNELEERSRKVKAVKDPSSDGTVTLNELE